MGVGSDTETAGCGGIDELTLEHYRARREYFFAQGRRLWTRFNFFLVAEGVVFVGYFVETPLVEPHRAALPLLGAALSALWFIVAAQDVWFFERYRKAIMDLEDRMRERWRKLDLGLASPHKDDGSVTSTWYRFKIPGVGVTPFASLTPLVFVLLWSSYAIAG